MHQSACPVQARSVWHFTPAHARSNPIFQRGRLMYQSVCPVSIAFPFQLLPHASTVFFTLPHAFGHSPSYSVHRHPYMTALYMLGPRGSGPYRLLLLFPLLSFAPFCLSRSLPPSLSHLSVPHTFPTAPPARLAAHVTNILGFVLLREHAPLSGACPPSRPFISKYVTHVMYMLRTGPIWQTIVVLRENTDSIMLDAGKGGNRVSSVAKGGPASAGTTGIWFASMREGSLSSRTYTAPMT